MAFVNNDSKGQIWGTLLNVVTGVHLVFLVISSIFSGKSASTRLKKLTGRLQFTIGSVNYKGKVGITKVGYGHGAKASYETLLESSV